MKYYLAIKTDEILWVVATGMNLEDIMLCEISQAQNSKYHMISQMYGIFKKLK
jgi:hypothetical protein